MITVGSMSFAEQMTPAIIGDEYYQCNFSYPNALDKDGKKVGYPLDIKATLVECNLGNREPGKDCILVRCKKPGIFDREDVERIKVDHTQIIKDSNLPDDTKKEMLKTAQLIESKRIIHKEHTRYGYFDLIKRKYFYRLLNEETGRYEHIEEVK